GYLMPEMNIRVTIALFMGLLLQLSQVQAWPSTTPAKSCGLAAAAMSCCASKQVCPCADQSDSDEKPIPLAPASASLKLVFTHLSATDDSATLVVSSSPINLFPTTRAVSTAGFPGVPLNVAFCTFVI